MIECGVTLTERKITVILFLVVAIIAIIMFYRGMKHEQNLQAKTFDQCLMAGETGKTTAVCVLPNGKKMYRITLEEVNLGGIKGKVGTYIIGMMEE